MIYENPILRGFNPDPSICRVGKDYYLVTSSFEYFPGIPVYHSTDLVNWLQIGNCIERPEQLPYGQAAAGQGVWAPTIRHHEGRFYVTATFCGLGNVIVRSEDPTDGWSDPVRVEMDGIDPSLLFEGGKAYYCTNQRDEDDREAISMAEIDVDTGSLLSPVRVIWHGMSSLRPQYLEAPHLYHKDGWYYLLAAEGGTKENHMITAARSRSLFGPYEDCESPLLTNRHIRDGEVACTGHGDLVEDERGQWWAVYLATRPDKGWYSHLGRETFLTPVRWLDDWPAMGDGRGHLRCEGPLWAPQAVGSDWQADLSCRQPQWLNVREPVRERYLFWGDRLHLIPSREKLSDPLGRPTFLCLRQADLSCETEVEFRFEPQADGSEAGLAIYLSDSGHYVFCLRREAGRKFIEVRRQGGQFTPVRLKAEEGKVRMKIEASGKAYRLSFAFEGQAFREAATVPSLSLADAGRAFTGTLIGIFAQCDTAKERDAEFLSFRMTEKNPETGPGVFHKTVLAGNSEQASACRIG